MEIMRRSLRKRRKNCLRTLRRIIRQSRMLTMIRAAGIHLINTIRGDEKMERVFNFTTDRLEEVEPAEAKELTQKGEAVRVSLPELDDLKRKADELHAKYEADVQAIKNS